LLDQLTNYSESSDGEVASIIKNNDNSKNTKPSNNAPVSSDREQDKISKLNNKNATIINSHAIHKELNYDQEDLFYLYFVHYLEYLLDKQNQITLSKLKELRKDLAQKQITDWLDRATEEELIIRQGKKRTYLKKEIDLLSLMND
jgi:translation initiation factor 2 beta subunit (eIF-2beta)/eIF-5